MPLTEKGINGSLILVYRLNKTKSALMSGDTTIKCLSSQVGLNLRSVS